MRPVKCTNCVSFVDNRCRDRRCVMFDVVRDPEIMYPMLCGYYVEIRHEEDIAEEITEIKIAIDETLQETETSDTVTENTEMIDIEVVVDEISTDEEKQQEPQTDERKQAVIDAIKSGASVTQAAKDAGISRQTASKWWKDEKEIDNGQVTR